MMFSVMKSWLMANVNWSSELLKGFSINDKWCCWLSCLLWHHKTFQEVASFIQGSPEEVAAFDGICDDLVMLYGQACLVITPLSPLGSHITSIKQIFFALNAELSPSDITQSPAFAPPRNKGECTSFIVSIAHFGSSIHSTNIYWMTTVDWALF